MNVINPEHQGHKGLGKTTAAWIQLKKKVTDFFKANDDKVQIAIADIKALDSQFDDQRVLNQMLSDLELIQIP